jgi:hypothetical protein
MGCFARSVRTIVAAASGVPLALASLALLGPGVALAASFDSLPPGGQKIARALYEAQAAPSTTFTPLTLDQIAEKKGGRQGGWGKVFKDMKAQGLVTQKNLGAVVSDHEHRNSPSSAARADRVDRDRGEAKGAASRSRDDGDRGSASPSRAGGMGHGAGAGHGGGRGR